MTAATPTAPPPTRRRRRVFLILAALLAVAGITLGGVWYLYDRAQESELDKAAADLDRLEPGWKLDQIEASRAAVPAGENAAVIVLAADKLVPANWGDADVFEKIDLGEPERQLHADHIKPLRAALAEARAALAEARKLADRPRGRYAVAWAPDYLSTPTPHLNAARRLARLLRWDAALCCQDGDVEGALASCRCAVNVGRSLGDDPFIFAQIARRSIVHDAVEDLQRVLAQGQPSAKSLRAVQQLLEDEATHAGLLTALRGERAGYHHMIRNMENGTVPLEKGDKRGLPRTIAVRELGAQFVDYLRRMNEAIEILRGPLDQQAARLARLESGIKGAPDLTRTLFPAVGRLAEAERRHRAELHAAAVGLALERFRQETGRWPDKLEEMAPKYLKPVPLDPYDNQPLRYRRLKDGAVVYAVGPDGKDDGGRLRPEPAAEEGVEAGGLDVGFRVWDVAHRRQPPLPPKRDDPKPDVPKDIDNP